MKQLNKWLIPVIGIILWISALVQAAPLSQPFAEGTVVPKLTVSTPPASDSQGLIGSQQTGTRVRIAGYNIAHARGNRQGGIRELAKTKNLDGIASMLKAQKVDVVGLTEISSHDLRAGFRDQPKYIAKKLGYSYYHYDENFQKWGGFLTSQGNAVVSRFPITFSKNHLLYTADPKHEKRSCLEVLLDLGKGRKVRVFVAHLSTVAAESTRQIQEIWALIEGCSEPVVLVGDFNSRPGHDRILWLKQRMTDTTANLTTTYLNKPGVKIDYHFIRGAVTAGTAWIKGFAEGYSDHGCVINDYWVK